MGGLCWGMCGSPFLRPGRQGHPASQLSDVLFLDFFLVDSGFRTIF